MRCRINRTAFWGLSFSILLIALSCQADPSSWYPTGKTTVLSSNEVSGGGVKVCNIALNISNIGKSTINTYYVSLSITTDMFTYYKTVSSDIIIPQSKSIYINIQVPFNSISEVLQIDGVVIQNEYYL